MDDFDIPIFKITYELYKEFYSYRNNVKKQDRHTLWQRCENITLDVLENLLWASQLSKAEKLPVLEKISIKLNFLRVFLRLCKEVKVIDANKYIKWQETVDEIGRQLGGWIRSTKSVKWNTLGKEGISNWRRMTAERRPDRCCSCGCRPSSCWHWARSRRSCRHWHGCRPKWHSLPIFVRDTGNWGLLPKAYILSFLYFIREQAMFSLPPLKMSKKFYLHLVHTLS